VSSGPMPSATHAAQSVKDAQPNMSASEFKRKSFKNAYLKNPSTYPIMGLVGLILTIGVGFIIKRLMTDPDVKLGKGSRNTMRVEKEEDKRLAEEGRNP
jgi:hypothetical protein